MFNKQTLKKSILLVGTVNILGVIVVLIATYFQALTHKGYCLIYINNYNEMWFEAFVALPFILITISYLCYVAWKK
jgi:hypothetical protein